MSHYTLTGLYILYICLRIGRSLVEFVILISSLYQPKRVPTCGDNLAEQQGPAKSHAGPFKGIFPGAPIPSGCFYRSDTT